MLLSELTWKDWEEGVWRQFSPRLTDGKSTYTVFYRLSDGNKTHPEGRYLLCRDRDNWRTGLDAFDLQALIIGLNPKG